MEMGGARFGGCVGIKKRAIFFPGREKATIFPPFSQEIYFVVIECYPVWEMEDAKRWRHRTSFRLDNLGPFVAAAPPPKCVGGLRRLILEKRPIPCLASGTAMSFGHTRILVYT